MDAASTLSLHTGRKMPVLGLGTWQLTNRTAETAAYAIELGYSLIDTSGDYGTQPGVGEAIRRSAVARDAIYVVTKVEETDDAYQATRKNLAELQLDFADLMLIHRPPDTGVGQDLWEGLIRAKQDGLARDIGVSNYAIEQIQGLVSATGETPVVNQIEWSPFGHSRAMHDFCRENRIVIQAYSPLTRGKRLSDERLSDLAGRYGKTAAQLLIRWNLQHQTVPVPKANQRPHLEENLDVFDFMISDEDMVALDDLNERYSSLGSLPYA